MFAYSITYGYITNTMIANAYKPTEAILSTIIATSDVNDKINLLAKALFEPPRYALWPSLAIGATAGLFIGWCTNKLLPKLAPRSFIAIGLARKRATEYYYMFQIAGFGAVLTIVLGISSSMLWDLIKYLYFGSK
jgi:hypothetical protein